MRFEDAVKEMREGRAVRLPDWGDMRAIALTPYGYEWVEPAFSPQRWRSSARCTLAHIDQEMLLADNWEAVT